MIINNKSRSSRILYEVIIDGYPVYRNEDLEFNYKTNTWDRVSLDWSIGNKKGDGPFVSIQTHYKHNNKFPYQTGEQLERDFQLKHILTEQETLV